jgi:hypothetical protein
MADGRWLLLLDPTTNGTSPERLDHKGNKTNRREPRCRWVRYSTAATVARGKKLLLLTPPPLAAARLVTLV